MNQYIKSPTYKEENTLYWGIHHTGGILSNPFASTKHLIAGAVNTAHQQRWNFRSSLGYFAGYTFYIDYWGNLTQFRAIGEETAAQKGWNFNGLVISICFAGNFNKLNGKMVDTPSAEQIASFRRLANELPRVKFQNIKPHWFFNQTECWGSGLPENWARGLVPELDERNNLQIILNSIQEQINQIMRLLKIMKLGGSLPKCEDSARG